MTRSKIGSTPYQNNPSSLLSRLLICSISLWKNVACDKSPIETPKFVYLIELKYKGTSRQALDQINDKQYARKYLTDKRRIFKIGATFSSTARTIESPLIEPLS